MDSDPRIAIVGIGGIFPSAPTLEAFWEIIAGGKNVARPAPPGRWSLSPEEVFHPDSPAWDRVYSQRACFIEGFTLDPSGLNLDPTLLAGLDPMFHLALHAARDAWRDTRIEALDRSRVGVVLAAIALPTETASALADETIGRTLAGQVLGRDRPVAAPTHRLNRHVTGLPAGLVAASLRLGGGAYTIDAACASSLYSLALAADELRAGRADAMLAGGVSRPDSLYTQMGFSQLRALSPTGVCAPFDAKGNGLVVGEGCGVFVLKRLADALAQGDRIHAVIRGIGLANDVGGSLMAPDSEGQVRAMREAYRHAGWQPQDVDLIECHGTGTPTGDAVEVESLRRLWNGSGPRRCVLGSVKSNVGHLLTGAGAAALTKVLLALRHAVLPPTANFERPNPALRLGETPFEVLSRPRAWDRRAGHVPRRAAVSGFGFGGINAHVLLEEWLPAGPEPAPTAASVGGGGTVPVAIVGLGACFGAASNLSRFRRLVLGREEPSPVDVLQEWGLPRKGLPIRSLSVPAARFRVPPRELEEMLPQQALFLAAAAEAWDDARADRGDPLRTGVYAGAELDPNATNFHVRWTLLHRAREWAQELGADLAPEEIEAWAAKLRDAAHPPLTANRTMGNLGGLVAGRVARAFHLGGPSFTLSGLEGSGLRALEAGVRALQNGEVDQALVGAVDLAVDVRSVAAVAADAVVGEGAAVLVLRRLDDAVRAGDRVYAVVRGLGAAADLAEAAARAHREAGIGPCSVAYVEASSPSGEAVATLARIYRGEGPPCAFASAAADVGHAGAASAAASLVKACLALHERVLPGARGLALPTDPGRCLALAAPQYWLRDRADGPRHAAVSSVGGDGTAVHALLEAREDAAVEGTPALPLSRPPAPEALFVVEADDTRGIVDGVGALRERARACHDVHRLAGAWWTDRRRNPHRALGLALVARDVRELATSLEIAHTRLPEAARAGRVVFSPEPLGRSREPARIAFTYPGSGNHFPGMGRGTFACWPRTLERQDRENARLASQFAGGRFWSDACRVDARAMIFGQVVLGTMMTDLVQGLLGVHPDAVLGYSLGETAGLFSLRAWRDRDEMLRRMEASPLFVRDLAGPCRAARRAWSAREDEEVAWTVGVVELPAERVRDALAGRARVYLLIVNTPGECVVGGDEPAVRGLVDALGCAFHPLEGITTVHCEIVRQVEKEYRDLHRFETRAPAGVSFYSGVLGRSYPLDRDGAADSIVGQALAGFDYPRVVRQAYDDGVRVFLEMGPGASCSRMIDRILEGRPHLARSVCAPALDGPGAVLRLAAHLVAERIPVDLAGLFGQEPPAPADPGPAVTLPVGLALPQLPRPPVRQAPPARVAAHDAGDSPAAAFPTDLAAAVIAAGRARSGAHETFLRLSRSTGEGVARALEGQMALLQSVTVSPSPVPPAARECPPRALGREECREFARGSVAGVLGPAYAEVDAHRTRVRLPDEPLMLVDRIRSIEGEPLSLTSGGVVTEHDVLPDAWYLDGGRIPTCIAVEAGQADLFLSGFLGIDRVTRGEAVYRLLDAVVTFHDGLPGPGRTIRYDIRIERFFRQGDTHLFRFRFDATVDGHPLLTMRDGCAGFFTPAQLAEGKGIVQTALDRLAVAGKLPPDWKPLAPVAAGPLSDAQVDALRRGELEIAFGPPFRGKRVAPGLRLPSGRMTLVHRVDRLEPTGGRFGLGLVRGEADIRPEDWFLTCHFVDDHVMPGTLMYECCLHTLRIFLLRLGWVADTPDAGIEPVPGIAGGLRCRGQVIEATLKVAYEVEVKELGYGPEPYCIADALMFADGKPIVEMTNLSLRYRGVTRADVEAPWQATTPAEPLRRPALFDRDRILAFAVGKPSEAFGDRYRVFDRDRVVARLPGPPYMFLDRIVAIRDCAPWVLAPGGEIEAEYEVPPDAWYFASDRRPRMPFAVLLETALQPCGWLAAYLGSALASDVDVSFRNLGGTAVQHLPVGTDAGTLTTRVKITQVSRSGGMILEHFDFAVSSALGLVYEGSTYFGFFTKTALADQIGIRDAPRHPEARSGRAFPFPAEAPFPDARFRMVDRVDLLAPAGGPGGLGFVRGSVAVDPAAWFFQAHFHQDPVWPGSLGLESMIQLMKVVGRERWGGDRFESVAMGRRHQWTYRGQVLPTDRGVTVEAAVTEIDDATRTLAADGFLIVDGRVIYRMEGFTLRMGTA